jgi:hypothetical protein
MAAKASGFVVFAGAMLMVTGLVNVFEGFIALFSDKRLVITREHIVIVGVTGWGWTILIFGLLLMAVGIGLSRRRRGPGSPPSCSSACMPSPRSPGSAPTRCGRC